MSDESQITAILFAAPEPVSSFSVLGQNDSLLLLIGITDKELAFHHEQGSEALLAKLKEAGVFPFTNLSRQSVV